FSKHTDKHHFKNNITIQPINNENFVKSLVSCNGIICGAGFETPAEALFLRKKLLVIPMKNQYEQQCNALALEEMGVPVLAKFNKKSLKTISEWLDSNQTIKVHYPDITEDIISAIITPYYNTNIIATTL
ncbi:glycosyltransferase family protein, partial [Tenacibaculum sp.]|nr:glycosyltransferase family protein [Tenacibaculum sp.]